MTEDQRIVRTAAIILVLAASLIGFTGVIAFAWHARRTTEAELVSLLHTQIAEVTTNVELRTTRAAIVTTRPNLRRHLRILVAQPSNAVSRETVRDVLSSFLSHDFVQLVAMLPNGEEIARAGSATPADVVVTLPIDDGGRAELVWRNGVALRHRLPLTDDTGALGTVIVEQDLPSLTTLLRGAPTQFRSVEFLLCREAMGGTYQCLPSRSSTKPVLIPAREGAARSLVQRAREAAGFGTAVDYRGHAVSGAYAPLPQLGLVATLKVDADELYGPVRRQLGLVLVVLAITTLGGWALIRTRVRPLARRLEEGIRDRTRDLQQANARLSLRHEIDGRLIAANTPQEIAERTVQQLRELLAVPRTIVFLVDIESGVVEWLAAAGRHRVHVGPGVQYSAAFMGDLEALKRGESQVLAVHDLSPSPEADALLESGINFCMVVPMMLRGRLIGGLSFGGPTREFSADQISIAEEVARQMAIVLDHAQLLKHVRHRTAQLEAHVQALGESEERYRLLTETVRDAIFMIDLEGRLIFGNRSAEEITGYSSAEFRGRPIASLLTAKAAQESTVRLAAVQAREEVSPWFETEIVRRDGGRVWVEAHLATVLRDGRPVGRIGVVRDITERRRVEESMRLLESAVRQAGESIIVTTAELEPPGPQIVFVNPATTRVTGYTVGEMLGRTPRMLQGPLSDRAVLRRLREDLSAGRECYGETINYRKDRTTFPVSLHITPVRDDDGRISHFVAIQRDLTEQKRAEAALRGSEERFRATFEQAAVGIGISALDGRWLRVNQRFCDMLGYTSEELCALSFQVMTHPDDLPTTLELRGELMTGRRSSYSVEKRYLHKGGRSVWVQVTVSVVSAAGGVPDYSITIVQDVTERKQLEDEFHHAQRMEGVGQLAGGIAHDFNNLLTVISARTELGLGRLPHADPLRHELELIHKTSNRAAALTRQLLAFSRKHVLQPKVITPNTLIESLITLLKRIIGENIELQFVPAPAPGRIQVDPSQLEQVIVNLAVNARDAMPDGGRLTIETADAELDVEYAARHVNVKAGPYVVLAVSDTGTGMSSEIKARIFEPFYTTKGPGRGTGLGLSTVYGIVKQSGGYIRVYSEPGAGTTFKIYFPHTDAAPEATQPATPTSLPRGTETVLLVEDEADVRELTRELLERLGYTVLEASRPTDARQIARQHVGLIDLLLTDVIMPRMSGRTLAETIAAERPEAKILFMSGYTDDAIVRHGVLEPDTDFLQKPFTAQALATKVREILDRGGAGGRVQ